MSDLTRVLHQTLDIVGDGQVDGERTTAAFGGERFEHVGAPAGQDQVRTAAGKGPGDGVADATGGAGQQHCGARNLHGRSLFAGSPLQPEILLEADMERPPSRLFSVGQTEGSGAG